MTRPGPQLRILGIWRMRTAGKTWAECGAAFGIVPSRAYAILKRHLFAEEWKLLKRECRTSKRRARRERAA